MPNEREPSFARGLVMSYLIMLTSFILVLIPVIGIFLAVTMVPYVSGALGSRQAHPRERVPLVLTCSITWSVLETALVLTILSVVAGSTPMGLVLEGLELFLIGILWLSNIIFMLLGAFHPWNDPYHHLK